MDVCFQLRCSNRHQTNPTTWQWKQTICTEQQFLRPCVWGNKRLISCRNRKQMKWALQLPQLIVLKDLLGYNTQGGAQKEPTQHSKMGQSWEPRDQGGKSSQDRIPEQNSSMERELRRLANGPLFQLIAVYQSGQCKPTWGHQRTTRKNEKCSTWARNRTSSHQEEQKTLMHMPFGRVLKWSCQGVENNCPQIKNGSGLT